MLPTCRAAALASLLGALVVTPALAERGGTGGDREPAGGAFNSSYLEPGSTGIQRGGPPRSVDIPRGYHPGPDWSPDATGSIRPVRRRYQPRW